jgi:hypothetical protein
VEVEGDEAELLGSSSELGAASIGGGRRRPWRRLWVLCGICRGEREQEEKEERGNEEGLRGTGE